MALAQRYGSQSGALWGEGDFNYDGKVGFEDLVMLAQNYGGAAPAPAMGALDAPFAAEVERAFDVAGVPEPAAIGMLWCGLIMPGRRGRGGRFSSR